MSVKAVFVGMPGAGKSTVGRIVAEVLGCEFRDSDELIVQAEGRSIASIFADDGEAGFRSIEARVVAGALIDFDGVLSLGGGAVLTASTRRILQGYSVILIDVDDDELVRRATYSSTVRPLLADDPAVRIAALRQERNVLYREVAQQGVVSGNGSIEDVVAEVLTMLDLEEPEEEIARTATEESESN